MLFFCPGACNTSSFTNVVKKIAVLKYYPQATKKHKNQNLRATFMISRCRAVNRQINVNVPANSISNLAKTAKLPVNNRPS